MKPNPASCPTAAPPRSVSHGRSVALLLLTALLTLAGPTLGQTAAFEYWPGASYRGDVATATEVLGQPIGEEILSIDEIHTLLRRWAADHPERMQLVEFGETWQGRTLVYAVLGSPANIARLDAIRGGMQQLANPRSTSADSADALIDDLPAVVWLAYGVHGNEISSPDAALQTAYHLLAAEGDPVVQEILDGAVVVIDPSQNPDGRDRFVHHFRSTRGLEVQGDRRAAEHDEPWPGGRTNHYLFDLNRDWFVLTQPETWSRVRELQRWYPLAFVDLHEMGGDSSYYFAPEAVPYNPHLAQDQRDALELFGRNNARWFDRYGFDYFTREIFDAFYPGYGASWPSYYGSVAMTYEQASARGMVWTKDDGRTLHFRDTVRHHFVASISTAQTAARYREKLLRDFWNYRRSAIQEGEERAPRQIVLDGPDPSATTKLARLLAFQGVEVERALEDFEACGESFEAGSYRVDLAQPAKRFVRTLLDADVPMSDEFLQVQEDRRARGLRDQIYDVTSWSVPMQFGVRATPCRQLARVDTEPVDGAVDFERRFPWATPATVAAPSGPTNEPVVGYVVPWGTQAAGRLLARALVRGLTPLSLDQSSTQGGRTFPAGSLVFKRLEGASATYDAASSAEALAGAMAELAEETGAEIVPMTSSWVDQGVNWGTNQAVRVRAPRVALAWDEPVSSYSAGATRYVLERQFGYPVTPVRVDTLMRSASALEGFHAIVLPDAFRGYRDALGKRELANLAGWVRGGGTLIAFGGAIDALTGEDGLLDTERQQAPEVERPGQVLESAQDLRDATRSDSLDAVSGVLLGVDVDSEHWLSAGARHDQLFALYRGRSIYAPVTIDDGTNVATFAGPDETPASGFLWPESREMLAHKPFVIHQSQGRGHVIAFTADPTVRAYLDGLNVLLLNAVLRGPAHADPVRW